MKIALDLNLFATVEEISSCMANNTLSSNGNQDARAPIRFNEVLNTAPVPSPPEYVADYVQPVPEAQRPVDSETNNTFLTALQSRIDARR
jgi:hypothetical protein